MLVPLLRLFVSVYRISGAFLAHFWRILATNGIYFRTR
jgi:hypothetical protein